MAHSYLALNPCFKRIEKWIQNPIKRISLGLEPSGKIHLGHYVAINQIIRLKLLYPDLEVLIYIADYHARMNKKKNIQEYTRKTVEFFSLILPYAIIRVGSKENFNSPLYWSLLTQLLGKMTVNSVLRTFPYQRKLGLKDSLEDLKSMNMDLFLYGPAQIVDPHYLQTELVIAGIDQVNIYNAIYDYYPHFNWDAPTLVYTPLLNGNLQEVSLENIDKKQSASKTSVALDVMLYDTVVKSLDGGKTFFDYIEEKNLQKYYFVDSKTEFLTNLKTNLWAIKDKNFTFNIDTF